MSQEKTPPPESKHGEVRSRNDAFAVRTATRIWSETPSINPYVASQVHCHGYDLAELMEKRSFVDVFYLLFRGELPGKAEAELLEKLMIALINPGPRHPATRAAMNAGIGKTEPVHILPIGLGVLGGKYQGAGEIESAMRFLRKSCKQSPEIIAQQLLEKNSGDDQPCPGFGAHYGGIDLLTTGLAKRLVSLPAAGDVLSWADKFTEYLATAHMGWFSTGLAAAVFCDLGFQPRFGGSLFQLLSAPGLAAHGLELANKPITAMPFVKDENYVIER